MDKRKIINEVLIPLENAGFKAYFVGGCVRDELLGKDPHDYDVVTNARPEDIHRIFPKIIDIKSESFGIVVININGENIEIATFRKDRECDGRHADVVYADTIGEDAERRDFTINALYQDKYGNIYDPTGLGENDIQYGFIRFIGSMYDRCKEDNLRILRYFRFAATLTRKDGSFFTFAEDIKEIKNLIDDPTFILSFNRRVSGERVGKELRKLISGKNAPTIINLMSNISMRMFDKIFPKEFYDLECQSTYSKYHTTSNNLAHSLAVFRKMCDITNNFELRAAALFHDVGKSVCQDDVGHALDHEIASVEICEPFLKENWKLTNRELKTIMNYIQYHMDMHKITETKHPEKIWKFMYTHEFDGLLKLLEADCVDVPGDYNDYDKLVGHPLFEFFKKIEYPNVFLGKDLMEFVSPGIFLDKGLEAANASFARELIKAYKYGTTGKVISKKSILKQAAERVIQLRKNEEVKKNA